MQNKCVKCKLTFDQHHVDYRLPDSPSNHYNMGECPDCHYKEFLKGYQMHKSKDVAKEGRLNKERLPLQMENQIRGFFVENYGEPDSIIEKKVDAFRHINAEFHLTLVREQVKRILDNAQLKRYGFVAKKRKRKSRIS